MYIKVRVQAGSKKESVEKLSEETFNISVKEKAERNQANTRVRELVAKQFDCTTGSIRIISGHQSPSKILSIPDKII